MTASVSSRCAPATHNVIQLLIVLLTIPYPVFSEISCGSLITYRQFDELLAEAPPCFQAACSDGLSTTAPLSMSSECAPNSACYPLWKVLRGQWQGAPCSESDCSGDIACRIGGWPILNGTAACNTGPDDWLFSGLGGCCGQGNEPLNLSDWMAVICNGSQWREPFSPYGGMAVADWQEWIEPWNWTVEPQNKTTKTFIITGCNTSKGTLLAFFADNIVSIGSAITETFVVWFLCICGIPAAMKKVKDPGRALFSGFTTGAFFVMSNFATAILWWRTAGYENISIGRVGLHLCSRPSILGILCFVSLFSDGIAKEAQWSERDRVKDVRRQIHRFARKLQFWKRHPPETLEQEDYELGNGRQKAAKLLATFALNISFGELTLQIMTQVAVWQAALAGGGRGFLKPSNLLPYYRGAPAYRMYAGALMHCIMTFLSVPSLVLTAAVHVGIIKERQIEEIFSRQARIISHLEKFYGKKQEREQEGRLPTAAEIKEAVEVTRQQRLLERMLFGRQDPGLWKRVWQRMQFWRRRPNAGTTFPQNLRTGKYPRLTKLHDALVRAVGATGSRLRLPALTAWAGTRQRHRQQQTAHAEAGPNYERFLELRSERRRQEEQGHHRPWWVPSNRSLVMIMVGFCVLANYTSQWLFWSGFVESSAER